MDAESELYRAQAQYDEYLKLTEYGEFHASWVSQAEETWTPSTDVPLCLVIKTDL